ncbi:uncharacterized protein LOC133179566 [Saccostrea echinata]|uniref:uncharacterized protein LOC133179566 n=1 Tax=Saccostrea echinata TaxID=191078 RepID=UPI002A808C32|nr:uncharacterized protein LOC133179566 [Saccostrea echinata]
MLDDFLLVGPPSYSICEKQLCILLNTFDHIGIPMKQDKTVFPTTTITFLGLELDTDNMIIRLPEEKLSKIRKEIFNAKCRKKMTLQEIQSLIGLLNFACAVVTPGRTFLRRLIDLTKGFKKPHHKRRITKDARADLEAWSLFIEHFNGSSFFLDDKLQTSETLQLYTDASGLGHGGVFGKQWFYGEWTTEWTKHHISVKELFPIVVAVHLWGNQMANKRICFFSDNMAVVYVINKQSAKDQSIMNLLRRLIVQCLKFNILFYAKHVPGVKNILSDKLSRLQIQQFRELAPHMDKSPLEIPSEIYKI